MQEILFQLLRLGLRTQSLDCEDTEAFRGLSESQWQELIDVANYQGVAGVALDGVSRIIEAYGRDYLDHFADHSFWRKFILNWAMTVERSYDLGNRKQLEVIADISKRWGDAGLRMMVMKGMAMGTYYPVPFHRAPGDIDCYLFEGYARGNELAKEFADKVDTSWYKHSQIRYKGQLIENHQYFVHTREGKSSKDFEKILVDSLSNMISDQLPGTNSILPPSMFNAYFLTYHAMTHFLEEGLKLKQLLDWAMFLKRDADNLDWGEFYRICDKFHMHRFADVATDIAVRFLGVELHNSAICCTSPYTEKVIRSTLFDKDYVFSSGQSGWANRWHIVRNLFKYRWKFHQIYQHSVLRQLWWYAIGYIFKTE